VSFPLVSERVLQLCAAFALSAFALLLLLSTLGQAQPAAPHLRLVHAEPAPILDISPGLASSYRRAARHYGVDWRLIAAVAKTETNHGRSLLPGVHRGLNSAGCCAGPMQICVVASCGNVWSAIRTDGDGDGRRSVYDPDDAAFAAARQLASLNARFGGRRELVLAGYNAGPNAVAAYGAVPPYAQTQAYVASAGRYIDELRRAERRQQRRLVREALAGVIYAE
jgi:soluble lytic murein transglycosylase-like protein